MSNDYEPVGPKCADQMTMRTIRVRQHRRLHLFANAIDASRKNLSVKITRTTNQVISRSSRPLPQTKIC